MVMIVKLEESDNGIVKVVPCKTHNWKDLPMDGLGKNFEGVGLYEHVIIPLSVNIDPIWEFTKSKIELRAKELGACVCLVSIPSRSVSDCDEFIMVFLKH
jgi:hypothetical protein